MYPFIKITTYEALFLPHGDCAPQDILQPPQNSTSCSISLGIYNFRSFACLPRFSLSTFRSTTLCRTSNCAELSWWSLLASASYSIYVQKNPQMSRDMTTFFSAVMQAESEEKMRNEIWKISTLVFLFSTKFVELFPIALLTLIFATTAQKIYAIISA